MDGCVLLTSTPSCVVSPRGETTHSGVDVNNTHPSMINPLNSIQGLPNTKTTHYQIILGCIKDDQKIHIWRLIGQLSITTTNRSTLKITLGYRWLLVSK